MAAKKKAAKKKATPRPRKSAGAKPKEDVSARVKSLELYLRDPDISIAEVARRLKIPLGRATRWAKLDQWKEKRRVDIEERRAAARLELLEAAREEVGGGFLRMLKQSREIRERVVARLMKDLDAEDTGELRPEEQEASSIEYQREEAKDGKTGKPTKQVFIKTKRVRAKPNDRLLLAFLESDKIYTRMLLGLVEGKPSPGAMSGNQDAEKIVRKLQAVAAEIDELEDPAEFHTTESRSERDNTGT